MLKDGLHNKLQSAEDHLFKVLNLASDSDGDFVPAEGMLSLSHQVAYIAQSNEWFLEGMFGRFSEEFDSMDQKVSEVSCLKSALAWLKDSFASFHGRLADCEDELLRERLPPGPIMGGVPRYIVVGALADNCAHHRGAVATYLKILGKSVEGYGP